VDIVVSLGAGKRVDARTDDGFVIRTDQSQEHGGDGSAPEPFTLFLASLASCAGFYVLAFCQARGIPTEGIRLVQHHEIDPPTKRLVKVDLDVLLPPSFPERYVEPVRRAAEHCRVKQTLAAPPELTVTCIVQGEVAAHP
jgi:ribosomal protein S12 methylthiotransferase accessory factor